MLRADDILIDRLRIRAPKGAAQQLGRQLAQESWPLTLPSDLRDAWVFVREVRVKTKAVHVRQQTASAVESLLRRAVDGGSPAAEQAVAVRFETLPELLAFLLTDIALGQALRKWYWARWSNVIRQTRDQAIAQLLIEHIEHLPTVLAHCRRHGNLKRIWSAITPAAARQIARQVELRFGIRRDSPLSFDGSELQTPIYHHAHRVWASAPAHASAWSWVLAGMAANDERVALAALVQAIELCPLLVMRDATAVTQAFVEVVLPEASAAVSRQKSEKLPNLAAIVSTSVDIDASYDSAPMPERASDTTAEKFSVVQASAVEDSLSFAKPPQIKSAESSSSSRVMESPVDQVDSEKHQKVQENTSISANSVESDQVDDVDASREYTSVPTTISGHFYTSTGGLFYLINAMSWWVDRDEMLAEGGNGFVWLYSLAQNLASSGDEPAVDITLERFLAHNAGIELEDLDTQPRSAVVDQLFERLSTRFADKPFWSAGESSLLCVPAQVIATPSHIDVYFSLSHVRLDIRLAGLDVNPGWVPWLGRVVQFHYVDSPISGGSGNSHE